MLHTFLIDEKIVPAVMCHSVGLDTSNWIYKHLSEPLDCFEAKIRTLRQSGYEFIFWSDLYDHMAGLKKLKSRSVMLTFDDGYLDNWVYVYPLLKKYDAKATIFVNPEFVDPDAIVRATSESRRNILPTEAAGFLSWEEMRKMEASGLIDIQSHSLTHTWHFSGDKVIDFYHPGAPYPWLGWNARVDRKPYYMSEDQSSFTPFGTPIFEHEKSLICRRFYPSENKIRKICSFALLPENAFWEGPDFCNRLMKEWHRLKDDDCPGHFESETEYRQRVINELKESKRVISEHLNKQVDFICWPGGGYNHTLLEIAKEVGYKAWTLSSKDQSHFRNRPGSDCQQIKRIGSASRISFRGKVLGHGNARLFYHTVRAHQGALGSKISLKTAKLLRLLLTWIKTHFNLKFVSKLSVIIAAGRNG